MRRGTIEGSSSKSEKIVVSYCANDQDEGQREKGIYRTCVENKRPRSTRQHVEPYSDYPAQPSHPITLLFRRPSRIRSYTDETLGIARLARTSTIREVELVEDGSGWLGEETFIVLAVILICEVGPVKMGFGMRADVRFGVSLIEIGLRV